MEYHNRMNQAITERDKLSMKHGSIRSFLSWKKLTGEELLRGLCRAFTAFLLGICRLPFSVYPLGMAFLCAEDNTVGFAAFGLAVSSLLVPLPWWLYCGTVALTLLIRVLTRLFVDIPVRLRDVGGFKGLFEHIHGRFFCESLYLRMTCSCVSVFVLSLWAIISGGFRYYDLFGAFLSMTVAPVATYLYAALSADFIVTKKWSFLIRKSAKIVLAFTLCLSVCGIGIATIPLSAVAAFLSTMILCRQEGLIAGVFTGILCGLSVGMTAIPVYAVAAVTAYCLFEISPLFAATVSCIAGSVTGMLMNGGTGLTEVFLPLLAGASVYCATDKVLSQGGIAGLFQKTDDCDYCERMRLERKYTQTCESLDTLCHSLSVLSETFSQISLRMRKPTADAIRAVCDEGFDTFCRNCSQKRFCWEERYAVMAEVTERLTTIFGIGGIPEKNDLPSEFYDTCEKAEKLIEHVNKQVSLLIQNTLYREKTGICAADYGAISSAVHDLIERVGQEYKESANNSAAVRDKLRELGFHASRVSVCGDRNMHVFVSGLSPIPENKRLAYLQQQLGKTLGCKLGFPLLTLTGNTCTLHTERVVTYGVTYGTALAAKEGICGDSARVFEDKNRGFFYAVINDGMGAGREASATAGISSTLLEKLLSAGVEPEAALKMLNHFLCLGHNSGSAESSTTVDLLCFDNMTGHAVFIKSGAAPTYVKRGTNIFKLTASTLPVGILELTDAKRIEFEAHDGDILILSSDGVSQGENECLWLLDYLNATKETEPQTIADYIKEAALAHGSKDDISALVIKIRQNI